MQYLDKLVEIEKKYDELTAQLSDPKVLADPALYQKAARASAELRDSEE
jgi:peptide chain release factor 1